MFNCSVCKESVGPGVSPVKIVTLSVAKEYRNTVTFLDEYDREQTKLVESAGYETAREIAVCSPCAGLETPKPTKTIVKGGKVFEEPLPKDPLRPTLAYLSIENALKRNDHGSKRGKADCEAAVPLVKQFLDRNKEFVF